MTFKKMKHQKKLERIYLQITYLGKALVSKLYQVLLQLSNKKTQSLIKK